MNEKGPSIDAELARRAELKVNGPITLSMLKRQIRVFERNLEMATLDEAKAICRTKIKELQQEHDKLAEELAGLQ